MNTIETLSELVTEMVEKGATKEELYRVVAYSQRAMDAEKAYRDYNILELERKYGGKNNEKRKA